MADTPPTPSPLEFIETGPDGGWCDARTGLCTTAAGSEVPLPEGEDAGPQAGARSTPSSPPV
ncbi:hypothetical protein [Streptomyces fuscichromogenes]|uniref:Uncharacterized protein n=1 Tax=Streptomyces fuscichromogenes TaxID=1324013 RepID=A0A917XBE8_9ACTN|nr:hypothetical protein [Streptomyces fuscichromogenes]GGN02113.1 hypothetical protein GCM10011578_024390 [Streptomyces fuscichromogenes]